MAVKIVEIKNNTTKTVALKKDSVIKFSDMESGFADSDIKFSKKGRNLIISSENNGFKVTVKKYFISAKKDISKINLKLSSKVTAEYNIGGFSSTTRLGWKLNPYDSKKTFYGTMWKDNIISNPNKYRKLYFYSGSDDFLTSFKYSQKVYYGAGTKSIYINPTATEKTSITTTFYANEDTVLKLKDLQDSDLKYVLRKKNDLVLSNNKNHKIVFKNYLTKDNKYDIQAGDYSASDNTSTYKNLKTYINSLSKEYRTQTLKKKGTLKGTYFNDILKGSAYKDKIYCVGGNNEVYADLGNDKIYCGSGVDKIVYFENDGTDEIYNATSSDILYMDTSDMTEFNKSGNDFIIGNGNSVFNKRDKIIIKDYFKNTDNRLNTVWDYGFGDHGIDDATYAYNLTNKTITVNGTKKKETHNLGKGKYNVYLNNGKDTLILDTSDKNSYAKINIDSTKQAITEFEKSGNDAILHYQTLTGVKKGKNIYKTGQIAVKDFFNTDLTSAGRGKSTIVNYDSIKLSNTSFKDFIKNTPVVHLTSSNLKEGNLYRIDGINLGDVGTYLGIDFKYRVTGSKKDERITLKNAKTNMIDSRAGNDVVHTEIDKNTKNTSTFCYSGGIDNYIAGWGNDIYYIGATATSIDNIKKTSFNKNTTLIINDKNGSDTVNFSAKTKDLRILFDVDKKGNIVTTQEAKFLRSDKTGDKHIWNSLLIFNKSALSGKNLQKMIKNGGFTGAVEIDNYFTKDDNKSIAGKIETFNSNDTAKINMDGWIASTKSEVAKWLNSSANTKDCSTASEVFASGDSKMINALVKIYTNNTYKLS